jgi:hypothetical protein
VPREFLRSISDEILHAQKPLKVLRAINWGPQVHERFFKTGAPNCTTVNHHRH